MRYRDQEDKSPLAITVAMHKVMEKQIVLVNCTEWENKISGNVITWFVGIEKKMSKKGLDDLLLIIFLNL